MPYYTASDVNLFINKVWLQELFAIQYQYNAPRLPVYGYESRHPDAWAEGRGMCSGMIEVNFKRNNELSVPMLALMEPPTAGLPDERNTDSQSTSTVGSQRRENMRRYIERYIGILMNYYGRNTNLAALPGSFQNTGERFFVGDMTNPQYGEFIVRSQDYQAQDGTTFDRRFRSSSSDIRDDFTELQTLIYAYPGMEEIMLEIEELTCLGFLVEDGTFILRNNLVQYATTVPEVEDLKREALDIFEQEDPTFQALNRADRDSLKRLWVRSDETDYQRLPHPTNPMFLDGVDMEIVFGDSPPEQVNDDNTAQLVKVIRGAVFTGEQGVVVQRGGDYIRVQYPFVAKQVI